ncbi:unnamed protein product [Prorocentrum cordatum]|uniref:Uncharacterized protein n=1 Tax=Prorocentrum cordatum TaxID=2364126 RepID=A0ABN9QQ72_9DINO|nr:unnamed protein product [Polarella glacialis]
MLRGGRGRTSAPSVPGPSQGRSEAAWDQLRLRGFIRMSVRKIGGRSGDPSLTSASSPLSCPFLSSISISFLSKSSFQNFARLCLQHCTPVAGNLPAILERSFCAARPHGPVPSDDRPAHIPGTEAL